MVQTLKAHVKDGRVVLDDPTAVLPEGTELAVAIVDEDDGLDDAERARLHEALHQSFAEAKAGQLIDADEVVSRLLARE